MSKTVRNPSGPTSRAITEGKGLERVKDQRTRVTASEFPTFELGDEASEEIGDFNRVEILRSILLLKGSIDGRAIIREWRLTLSSDHREHLERLLSRLDIEPFL
jgi:hypothetical protein